jgi:hypothetical protein
MRRRPLLTAILLLAAAAAVADTTTGTAAAGTTAATAAATATAGTGSQKPDLSLPADTAEKWVVGFTALATDGLSAENRYLASSLPLMLRDDMSGLTTHTYTAEETDGLRKLLVTREVTKSQQAISSARKERDALLFGDAVATTDAWKAADAKILLASQRLDFLRGVDPGQVTLRDSKPVSIKSADDSGRLLDTPKIAAPQYCAQQSLDLLVGGSLQEVQGYLLLDLWAYDAALHRIVFTARDAARRDDLYADSVKLGKGLADSILGRPWALVRFAPDPPSATLAIDGVVASSGASPSVYVAPGPHVVLISAAGHASVTRSVLLSEGVETVLDDKLERTATGSVAVATDPPGAALYIDSIWVGRTPLSVDLPSTRSRGVLTMPGFYDLPFALEPDSRVAISFSLQKDLGSRDELRKKAREDFYTSFGWFALSVPFTLFSYGMAIDFGSQAVAYYYAGDYTSSASAKSTRDLFSGTYYGGIAVNVALFTWMVFRIINYVTVSNGTAG